MVVFLRAEFTHVYSMDMMEIVWLAIFFSGIYMWMTDCFYNRSWWRFSSRVILICSLMIIIYATVGDRTGGNHGYVNLIPFHSYRAVQAGANPELYRSNFMNAALFYPAGLLLTSLLPQKWQGWCRCMLTVVLLATMSGAIEYTQYRCALGNVEIDDVIHNTAGALAGSLAAEVLSSVTDRIKKIVKKETK